MTDEKGFMIVTCKIDPAKKEDFKHYVQNARPIFVKHGGRSIGQYAVAETEIGDSQTTHVIIMEFPGKGAIRSVFSDPDYIELVPRRTNAFPVLDIMISEEFNPAALLQA
jgi:uncharacterized protein (DUF1330 family)